MTERVWVDADDLRLALDWRIRYTVEAYAARDRLGQALDGFEPDTRGPTRAELEAASQLLVEFQRPDPGY